MPLGTGNFRDNYRSTESRFEYNFLSPTPLRTRNNRMRSIQTIALLAVFAITAPVRAADFEAFIPNNTDFVVSIDVRQLLDSPLGKKHLHAALEQTLKDNPQAQEFLKALNFDPVKDIGRLTIAMSGTAKDDALAIVNGKFDREKIEAFLAKAAADTPDKVKIHKAGSIDVYEMINDEKKANYAGFASSTTILAGPKLESVRSALSGSGIGSPKKTLTSLFPMKANPTAWVAALPSVIGAIPGDDADLKKTIEGLNGIHGSLNVNTSAALSITLDSKTAQANQATADKVKGLLSLLNQVAPGLIKDQPELASILQSLKMAAAQKSITISVEFSGPAVEKLLERAKKSK
jgi:hypothetical protein